MKALILSAGYGTRLLPYTRERPKPLFTLNNVPLLQITIARLVLAGCEEIMINCHHLAEQIMTFVEGTCFNVPVHTRFEPEILDTGGAIKNNRDFFGNQPFIVVNGDITFDTDLEKLINIHRKGSWPATLCLVDDERFNTVSVDSHSRITGFDSDPAARKRLTFTGIQVLNPEVFQYMPEKRVFSSIEVYRSLIKAGKPVKAYIENRSSWNDIGTPESYTTEGIRHLSAACLTNRWTHQQDISICRLAGDGSDRGWYRSGIPGTTVIVADHGIKERQRGTPDEMASFLAIGKHLRSKELPVPEIFAYDRFSGLVAVEDLGDTHLAVHVNSLSSQKDIRKVYHTVTQLCLRMSLDAAKDFNSDWTCQTPDYSEAMILDYECRYFYQAFVNDYRNMNILYDDLLPEFQWIARTIQVTGAMGFMHRDFQSRNIMIRNDLPWIIDFQGGRIGPVQYDLASLLIDPYVNLETELVESLIIACAEAYQALTGFDVNRFMEGYRLCSVTRSLQMLGAFSFLSRVRGKTGFESHIPAAVKRLKYGLSFLDISRTGNLRTLAEQL